MPSDTPAMGTYVLQTFGPEWRVARLSTVENLYEEQDTDSLKWSPNVNEMIEAFKDSKVFTNFEQAWDHATKLELAQDTEYGANLIRDFETLKFSDVQAEYIKNHS